MGFPVLFSLLGKLNDAIELGALFVEPIPKNLMCANKLGVTRGIQQVSARMPGFPLTPAGNHKKNGVRGLPSGYLT